MRLHTFSVAILLTLYTISASLGESAEWEQNNRQFLHSLSGHIRLRLDDPTGLATKKASNQNSLKALESLMNAFEPKSAKAFKEFQSKLLRDDSLRLETLQQRLGYEWIQMGKEMQLQRFHQSGGGSSLDQDPALYAPKRLVWLIGISVFSLEAIRHALQGVA
jgi:hypothetical protein